MGGTHLEQIIPANAVKQAASRLLGQAVSSVTYQAAPLHGGTLGDVRLVTGLARLASGGEAPVKLVWKRQKKWLRDGDPDSWRREYDLYVSPLEGAFTEALRWPACYGAALEEEETSLWMEYIDGVSGEALTPEMLEEAAYTLGQWQGRLYRDPAPLGAVTCLLDEGYLGRFHAVWQLQAYPYEMLCSSASRIPDHVRQLLRRHPEWDNGKSLEYNYLRSADYTAPDHLKQMLIGLDDGAEAVLRRLRKLPVILCHRDFWIENIFWTPRGIRLIDWDCAGMGYLGEDIASLVIDDTPLDRQLDYYRRLAPAYYRGLGEQMTLPPLEELPIREIMLLQFGYRILQGDLFSDDADDKAESAARLQNIFDMKDVSFA